MRRRSLILFVLLLVVGVAHADDVVSRLLKGQDQIFARDYAGAQATFESLDRDFPQSPAGPFGIMAMWQIRMFENRDFQFVGPYFDATQKMIARCEDRLFPSHPDDWDLLVCGAGFGMKGFFDVRQEKWMKAVANAQRSIRAFRRLLYQNPQFIDADVGIGGYEFWRSVVTQRYKWMPFFSDQRASGMAKVEKVAREGKYVRDLARANYAYMQIEMKQYDPALQTLRELLVKYPRNFLLQQTVGEVAWLQKRYPDCYTTFSGILKSDPAQTRSLYWMAASSVMPYLKVDPTGAPKVDAKIPDEIATRAKGQLTQYLQSHPIPLWASASHYWLAVIAEWQNDKATAITEYNEALKLDDDGVKEIKKRLERLQKS